MLPEKRAAREELAVAMRAREDEPLINDMRNNQGNFCFLGLAFETLRNKEPDRFDWDGSIPIRKHVPYHRDYSASTSRHISYCYREIRVWLGIKTGGLATMVGKNDRGKTWDELSDCLMETPYSEEEKYDLHD